jgi:hypothetical protein
MFVCSWNFVQLVITGLDPVIHAAGPAPWMAASSPAMTM